MHAAQFILYVTDQATARDFYRHVLAAEPVLDVPGMTEFDLGGATLGLMPGADIEALLDGQVRAGDGQRCELYLRRGDAAAVLARAADGGGRLLDGLRERSWGERVGYLLDPDGHVLALAEAASAPDKAHRDASLPPPAGRASTRRLREGEPRHTPGSARMSATRSSVRLKARSEGADRTETRTMGWQADRGPWPDGASGQDEGLPEPLAGFAHGRRVGGGGTVGGARGGTGGRRRAGRPVPGRGHRRADRDRSTVGGDRVVGGRGAARLAASHDARGRGGQAAAP